MIYPPLPNIPWEERPSGCSDVIWRYHSNPIIPRNLIPSANSIFNSAVVPFNGHFAGVFRCDNRKREMNLNRGFSPNGIDWVLDNTPIVWQCDDTEISGFLYRYDPRVVWLDDRYYVTWCNGYHGPTLSCRSIETAYFFHGRLTASTSCSAVRAITVTPRLATFISARVRT